MSGHPRLNVTLTGTANQYLTDRLPLRGEIELFELGVNGRLINAVFRILSDDGRLGTPVTIAEPSFWYDSTVDKRMFNERTTQSATEHESDNQPYPTCEECLTFPHSYRTHVNPFTGETVERVTALDRERGTLLVTDTCQRCGTQRAVLRSTDSYKVIGTSVRYPKGLLKLREETAD